MRSLVGVYSTDHISELERIVATQEQTIITLKEKLKKACEKAAKFDTVSQNMHDHFAGYDNNSQLRRPIAVAMTKKFKLEDAAAMTGLSMSTISSGRNESNGILKTIVRPRVLKKNLDHRWSELTEDFLNDLIPVVSGRDFR